jgi:hypothetical protein
MIKQIPIATFIGEVNPFNMVDYKAEVVELSTVQFKNRIIFNRYLDLLITGQVELQVVLKDLMQNRSLDSAIGAQLDVIGRIVGQPRQLFDSVIIRYFGFAGTSGASPYKSNSNTTRTFGPWKSVKESLLGFRELNDEEYRRLIKLKIIKNTSSANITALNDGARILFGVDNIDYQEDVPLDYLEGAAVTIGIGRDYNDPEKAAFSGLDEITLAEKFLNRPLGVAIYYQEPLTFFANFVKQRYQKFVFGFSGLTLVPFETMFTFTRPYTETYTGSTGAVETAAIDEPRFSYTSDTLEPVGLLIGDDEVLTHTWGLELNDSQGTFRVELESYNTSATEVVMVLEGNGFKMVLFRQDTYWKLRVEEGATDNYEMVTLATDDNIIVNISYTPNGVYFLVDSIERFLPFEYVYNATNLRGFDMVVGGDFLNNSGVTYDHFNGALKTIGYLRPYIGKNEKAVVDGMQITTEDYERILNEFGEALNNII